MPGRRIASSRCVHCGERMRDGRVQPHCLTDECNRGYAEYVAKVQVRQQGECEVWTGKHSSDGTPMISVRVAPNGSKDGLRKDHRVLDLRYEMAGRAKATYRRYTNLCGTPDCVTIDHHTVISREPVEDNSLPGHLDPAPLQRRLDISTKTIPNSVYQLMRDSMERGWITVGKVDEICCEVLGLHPVELYGEEFFTA